MPVMSAATTPALPPAPALHPRVAPRLSARRPRALALTALIAMLQGCGGGGGSTVAETADGYTVSSGVAQKGPIGRGGVVTINELTAATLAPNGKSYTFETVDDFGTFKPTASFSSPYLETTVQGYYFNELTGARASEWVVLRGLSDLVADRAVNVNVLTSLTKDRIRKLMTGGKTLATARVQAQRELLDALAIYNVSDLLPGGLQGGNGSAIRPANFSELDLKRAGEADQVLAAVSGLIVHIGQTAGGVVDLMNRIETDLADDGLLNNSPSFRTAVSTLLAQGAATAPIGLVANNLNSFYGFAGFYSAQNLGQWLDTSGGTDRVIDKHKFVLTQLTAGVEALSPPYTVNTDDIGRCVAVSAGRWFRNGAAQNAPAVVSRGDRVQLALTPYANQTSSAYLQRYTAGSNGCGGSAAANAARLAKFTVSGAPTAEELATMPAHYLGANLSSIVDYSPFPVYADLVKQARVFGPTSHPWGGANDTVPLGADGWPTGDFGVFLMTGKWLFGTYKGSFTGQATIGMNGTGDTTITNKVYNAATNTTTFDIVRGSNAEHMALTFSNVGSGIKNLRIVRPGYDALNPPLFTNEFLTHVARFKTLRFMEMLRTNGNDLVTSWASRPTPTTRYASAAGVPWEHIIELGNLTGKDLWINIPTLADDDYVRQLAQMLKSQLTGNNVIYVEYSNELWNFGFSQSHRNRDLATAEVAANPSSPLAYDKTTDQYTMAFRRTAKRGKEISDIFRSVYGDAAMMTKIRPVLGAQVVNTYIARVGLNMIEAVYGPPSKYFYALAGAPYFNMGSLQQTDGLSTDQVLAALGESIDTMTRVNALEANMALARWYDLKFLGYEGGPDTFGGGSIAAKKAANLDPRMLDLCKRYLQTWYAAGGEGMMWYTAGASSYDTQYGAWGLTNDIAVTDAPKIQCMDQTLAQPLPALSGRNQVPGTIDALAYVGNLPPYSATAFHAIRYMHPGSYADWALVAPASGNYSLVIKAEAGSTGNVIEVSVNGKIVNQNFTLAQTGWNTPADNVAIPISLTKGFNTLRIKTKVETTGFGLTSLIVR